MSTQLMMGLAQHYRGATAEQVLEALSDEFRVRLAQSAMLGYDADGFTKVPGPVTPRELWDYYVKYRTEASVKMLPLPVSQFVPQVKDTPTQEELKTLFEKYKEVEYSPASDKPGFMLSRQLKIEWISASPKDEYYRKQAAQRLLGAVASIPSNPLAGPAVAYAYQEEMRNATLDPDLFNVNFRIPNWTEKGFELAFCSYRHLQRPEGAIGVLGMILGQGGTSSGAFGMLIPQQAVAHQTMAYARESKNVADAVAIESRSRVPFAIALLGTGTQNPAGWSALGAWSAAKPGESGGWRFANTSLVEPYLPLEVMKEQLTNRLRNAISKELVTNSLSTFKTDLETRKKEAEKQKLKTSDPIPRYVKGQIAQRGWKTDVSKDFHDRYSIADDPNLKPLKDAYLAPGLNNTNDPKAKRFANLFFNEREKDKPYSPKDYHQDDREFVYWIVADQPPTIELFDTVKSKVEAAWRFDKARLLAKAEADRIAKEAQKAKGDAVKNLTDAAKGKVLVTVDGIAHVKHPPVPRAGTPRPYESYKVPDDKIEYPVADFVKTILDLKEVGDVVVTEDMPKSTYFVVTLTDKREPPRREFQDAQLLPSLEQQRRMEYRQSMLEYLRAQAKITIDDENRKMVDEKRGSSQEDE